MSFRHGFAPETMSFRPQNYVLSPEFFFIINELQNLKCIKDVVFKINNSRAHTHALVRACARREINDAPPPLGGYAPAGSYALRAPPGLRPPARHPPAFGQS